jgi:hypothetical protein
MSLLVSKGSLAIRCICSAAWKASISLAQWVARM